ncbi:uncharacterized protein TNCV_3164961 [Trichonephila clavipes]|nr:uncharacterized protein TNCV_3164961 [Trichonephila clavipes]
MSPKHQKNQGKLYFIPTSSHKAYPSGDSPSLGGEPKSVKRLRSGNLLIETSSALQTKSLLLATSFLDSPLTISPHKSLNTSRGVISEPDLLSTPEAEILDGFSDQARKLIAPQLTQTYAQATKPSIATSTIQTDENITKIKCPPLQLLRHLSSVSQPNAAPSVPSVSTSSSTIQANLLPSASSIKPTTQIESRLPESISASAAVPDNSLNTSTSSLSTETCPALTTYNKFAALQPSVPLTESATIHPIANFLIHLKSHRM